VRSISKSAPTTLSPYTAIACAAWGTLGAVWLPGYFAQRHARRAPRMAWQLGVTTLIAASVVLLFCSAFGGRVASAPAALAAGGTALCWASALLAIWARVTLGRNWSGIVVSLREHHTLTRSGPDGAVRHPIYAGLLGAMLGTALTIGSQLSWFAVATGLVAFLLRIRVEEQLMMAAFPEAYAAYRARTKALVLGVL
jgi:protein-S-isoprenylcysteine O-methyltransferase Ste14